MKKRKEADKEYIITYRSHEHYEVLGWVRAASAKEAIEKARTELRTEIERYGVRDAAVGEWRGSSTFSFDGP